MVRANWRECPVCERIFDAKDGEQIYHSRECARTAQWAAHDRPRNPSLALIREFLDQPEIDDPDAVRRALRRVFKW